MNYENMKVLLTSRKACLLLDIPASTLTYWVRESGIRPVVPAEGRGTSRMLTVQQVWAVGLAKAVRSNGQSVDIACGVVRAVDGFDLKAIKKAFVEKRTCLFVTCVDSRFSVLSRFVGSDFLLKNFRYQWPKLRAGNSAITVTFMVMDVHPSLDQILKAVELPK